MSEGVKALIGCAGCTVLIAIGLVYGGRYYLAHAPRVTPPPPEIVVAATPPPEVHPRGGLEVRAVARADAAFYALLSDGRLMGWGKDLEGASVERPRLIPGLAEVVQVAATVGYACAVVKAGLAFCWGDNSRGQLGNGEETGPPRTAPTAVLLSGVKRVALAPDHACALTADESVSCWGGTPRPVAGLKGAVEVAAASGRSCARLKDGSVRCWGAQAPAPLKGLPRAEELAVGEGFVCARLKGGAVSCLTDSRGEPASGPRKKKTGIGSLAVKGLTGVVELVAEGKTVCARLQDGTVRCWDPVHQETGPAADLQSKDLPTPVPDLDHAVQIAVGCATVAGNSLRCWGRHPDGLDSPGWTVDW